MSTNGERDKEKFQHIQVFIRVRPMNKQEYDSRSRNCVEVTNNKQLTIRQHVAKHYHFDKVFGPTARQMDIYKAVVEPLIPEVLSGYNCTVFAYGQTGTGKTYTMAGGSVASSSISWQNDQEAGIIPRAMSHLFDELYLLNQQYTVRVSYLELYNEELFDLLAENVEAKGIRLFEDQQQKGSVIISGIVKETVYSKNEVYEILQKGQERRKIASTLLNAQSSRSHTVFSIMVHTCETSVDGEELVKTGKLNLVDLAGSENVSRSGAVDRRAREAGNINQALLTLGRVIKALVERSSHIPYRESKLTRILQDSLGGRTKTSIIATVSPSGDCLDETLSTLEYANRARNIANRPEVNQRVSQKFWKTQFEKEIERLRKDLHASRTGTGMFLDRENYDHIVVSTEMCKEELAEKVALARELEQQIRILEEQRDLQEQEWQQLKLSFKETRNKLAKCKSKLRKTLVDKIEQQHLANAYETKAENLHEEACKLMEAAKATISSMHKKIDHLRSVNKANNDSVKKVSLKVLSCCDEVVDKLIEFKLNAIAKQNSLCYKTSSFQNYCTVATTVTDQYQTEVLDEAGKFVGASCSQLKKACDEDILSHKRFLQGIREKLQEANDIIGCIDMEADLHKDMMVDLTNATTGLNEQKATIDKKRAKLKAAEDKIEQIAKLMDETRECLHEAAHDQEIVKQYNVACSTHVSNAINVTSSGINTAIEDCDLRYNQVVQLLSNTVKIIDENNQPACKKVSEQILLCKEFFNKVDCDQSKEDLAKNLKENVLAFATDMKNLFATMNSDVVDITNQVLMTDNTIQEQKDVIERKVQESKDSLANLVDNQFVNVPEIGTPIQTFDMNGLTRPSPKERVLSRFCSENIQPCFDESLEEVNDALPKPSSHMEQ